MTKYLIDTLEETPNGPHDSLLAYGSTLVIQFITSIVVYTTTMDWAIGSATLSTIFSFSDTNFDMKTFVTKTSI